MGNALGGHDIMDLMEQTRVFDPNGYPLSRSVVPDRRGALQNWHQEELGMRLVRWVVLASLLASPPAAAVAQVAPDVARQIEEIGRRVDPSATARVYTQMQEKPPYVNVRVQREIKFGEDPKQSLDVFSPTQSGAGNLPVLVMVHGGGFVAGDKSLDENGNQSAFYDNVMLWAVRNGMVGVNINYRLAPAFQYPAVQQDIGSAIRWVHENIARFGGDKARIALMGHSAGAAHVGSYIAHPEHGPSGTPGVEKVILSSGMYDFTPDGQTPHPYFGAGSAELSSIPGLVSTKVPFLVIVGELDPTQFHVQAGKLMAAVCATGSCPPFVIAKSHGHMSGVYSINTPDQSLSGPILAFLRGENPHLSAAAR
jgi:acetyl esterase/lipase